MPSSGIRRYRGATIFDDRQQQQRRSRNLSPNNRAASGSRSGSQHHNPYDYGHHYRDLSQQRQVQQEQHYQQHYQQQQEQHVAQQQGQQQHQVQHQYRRSRNRNTAAKKQHASTSNLTSTSHHQNHNQTGTSHNHHQHNNSGHYSDSIGVSAPHVFPVVKLHRRSAHFDENDQDEYLTKRKVEKKTTKETEKTVKRKILLGDGRVIEDEPPETVRDLIEDTTMKEQEHFDYGRNRGLADRQLTRWKSAGDDIVDDSWQRTTNTRDVQENMTQTAATKNLGMVSKRAVDRAIKDKVSMREAVEAEKERKKAKQRRRERERERQELLLQRQQRDQLLNYDSGGRYHHSYQHDRNDNITTNKRSSNHRQQEVIARTPEPEVVYSSKKHRRTIDTEDVHNISRRLENGKVLTETYKTEEHEVMDDQEEPDSQSDAASEKYMVKDKQGYSHKKKDEFTDYYNTRGRHLGKGAHATTEERRIEKGKHDWEEISERMRREREKLRQRLAAGESAERKDALTKKPLNYNQEEKTRKKETDKWLERHFGSDWSLTTPSLSSGSDRHRLRHRSFHRDALNTGSGGHQNSSMRNTLGVGDTNKNGVRRSMSFSSIPVSYTQHPPPGQEINRTQTKTKEKVTKTTTTTYKPLALGFDHVAGNKESSKTVTREVPIMHSQTHTMLVTPRSKSATLQHPYHHKSAGNINTTNNNINNSSSTRNININFETGQSSTLRRDQRDKISPTSPRQYHSTLSLTTPRAEYVLDEPLRAPSRLTTARSTGHLLQHHYMPSELLSEQESIRSRGRRSNRTQEEKRSASANDNPQQNNNFHHSYAFEEKHTQRSASASSNEDARFGRNSRFAQHIVEERGTSPTPRRLVEEKDSFNRTTVYKEKKNKSSEESSTLSQPRRRKTPPLYVTEFKQDNSLLYPAHSENNLLFNQREYHSLGAKDLHNSSNHHENEEEVHVGRKKSLISHNLNQQKQHNKESQFRHEEKERMHNAFNGGGHVSFADRLDRPADHLRDQQVYTNYSNGRNSSYHGFRSLERNEGMRSKSNENHHQHHHYGGSEDEELTSTSSGSKGSSARHRRRARSKSFLVKSTRPQYAYALRLPRDAPQKGPLESDFVYDRDERRFVEDSGMRHGHSDLRLDVSSPQLHCSREVIRQEEMQLEPQKFKTIIFLNGH